MIQLDPSGHLLVRGQAGSGKITVLAARAAHVMSSMNSGTLLFLTYNSALSARIKNDLESLGLTDGIGLATFHNWAKLTSKKLGINFTGWKNQKERKYVLNGFLDDARTDMGLHRLYVYREDQALLDWYGDEIAWIYGQHVNKLKDYEIMERAGRGTLRRLRLDERKYVWTVLKMYEEWLAAPREAALVL